MTLRIAIIHSGFDTVNPSQLDNIIKQFPNEPPMIEHTRSIFNAYDLSARMFDIYILSPFWQGNDHGGILTKDIREHNQDAIVFSLTTLGEKCGWEDHIMTFSDLKTDRAGELIRDAVEKRKISGVETRH